MVGTKTCVTAKFTITQQTNTMNTQAQSDSSSNTQRIFQVGSQSRGTLRNVKRPSGSLVITNEVLI